MSTVTVSVKKHKIKILLVCRDADSREQLYNLLKDDYLVEMADDGDTALVKIHRQIPAAVLCATGLPGLGEARLLQQLKQSALSAHVPFILFSEQDSDYAGHKAVLPNADDFFEKPFATQAVSARVNVRIRLAATRLPLQNQLNALFLKAPMAICVFKEKNMVIELANEKMLALLGKTKEIINKPLLEVLPEIKGQGFFELLDKVYTTGDRVVSEGRPAVLMRNDKKEHIHVKFVAEALYDEEGGITGVMAVVDETTEEVASKKGLEVSEKKYQHLIENLPIAIYTSDAEGYITLYNQAATRIWGDIPVLNKEKWCGSRKLYQSNGITSLPLENFSAECFLKAANKKEGEIIIEKETGERMHIQLHRIPSCNEDGKMSGAINMLVDITEQKNAQKKIDENQLLFKTISNSAPVGLWIANAEGKCTFVNQTWLNWTGSTLEETLKEGWFKQLVEEDKEEIIRRFRLAFEKRDYFTGEFRLKRVDGKLRWCLTEGYPFNNSEGVFVGYTGSVTDITEKKTAQYELERTIEERTKSLKQKNKELEKSEEKYHRMTEEVKDYAIILLDKDGKILNWNKGAKKIKGYTEEEVLGKSFRMFYLSEDLEICLPEKLLSRAAETGRSENEGWRIRKNGTTFWASVVITTLYDEKSNIVGFSKVTRDLTEKKLSEDTMKRYMVELEKRNAELEQFAYVSSHDLQEPLRKIRTFSDLLKEQVTELSHQTYLQKINSSAERMSNLIKDLLDYSRLVREEERFVDVDLNVILENVKTDLEVAISRKKAVIEVDHLPVIKGIPLQFNQLFLNLLSNSLKFNTGTPHIQIQARPALLYETVAAKLDPNWTYLKLTFSDNGIGFDPKYTDQIFTIFQRLNTSQKFSGTGIGLAMCKKIIDNHGGSITASGNPDLGAAFTIYLPFR